jgi:predicted acylesterase/phospholipase RssA
MLERRDFLSLLAAAPAAGSLAPPSGGNADIRVDRALVLSGGGARGAYQAGIIDAMVKAQGLRDGEPLPGVDVVCGTSIGAINGWFIATAQYTALWKLWTTIANQHLFRLKHTYRLLDDPGAGVIDRTYAALALEVGLVTDVRAIYDSAPIEQWIDAYVNPAKPVLIPLVIMATNLDKQRGEVFYRLPFTPSPATAATAARNLTLTVGTSVVVREATDAILRSALRASSAIPVLLDPVKIADEAGITNEYIDGGITNNTPIDVARALARRADVILMDPDGDVGPPPKNALEVGVASFGIAQHRILESSLRSAYLETLGKRTALTRSGSTVPHALLRNLFDVDLYTIQPASVLPVDVTGFDDQVNVNRTYDRGFADGLAGFTPYVPDFAP